MRAKLKEKHILHQLRHAGPCRDVRSGHRSLADVKSRDRWAADSSLARHESHALIQKQVHKEGADTMKRGLAAAMPLHLAISKTLGVQCQVSRNLVSSKSSVALGTVR